MYIIKFSKFVLLVMMFFFFLMLYFDVDFFNCFFCFVVFCYFYFVVLLGLVVIEVYLFEDVLRDMKKVKIIKVRRMKSFDEVK